MKTDAKASSKTGSKTGTRKAAAPKSKVAKPKPSKTRTPKASSAKSGASKAEATAKSGQSGKTAKSSPKKPDAKKSTLKKPSGLDLAAKILAESDRPLNAKEIAERVIAAGWTTSGKTPHATLYSAMLREIKGKGEKSRFVLAERGRFGVNNK